jgi:hypothetical protein
MPVEILKEKFTGKVQEVVLGATKEEGGTRARTVKLGGSSTLPFLQYEGEIPNPPAIAFEVWDIKPDWHECFEPYYGDVWNDPVAWAKKAEELGADVIYLEFKGITKWVLSTTDKKFRGLFTLCTTLKASVITQSLEHMNQLYRVYIKYSLTSWMVTESLMIPCQTEDITYPMSICS